MRNKKILVAILSLCIFTITAPMACSSPASPAQFEITSLNIRPAAVSVGETAAISAQITNIGGSRGFYSATLSVDGKKIDTQTIDLDAGYSRSVTFSISEDKAGTYKIGIGDKSTTLTVESNLVAKQVELTYDDGVAKDCLSLVKPCTGYLIDFVSPPNPFTISTVRVFGLIYGSPGYHITNSQLQIWDKDQKILYTTPFTGDGFPLRTRIGDNIDSTGDWVDIDMPDVQVEGNFYVHIYTGNPTGQGFRMGAGGKMANTHSDVTVRGDNGIDNLAPDWPYSPAPWFGDKSRVNWMVRVIGKAMVPQE